MVRENPPRPEGSVGIWRALRHPSKIFGSGEGRKENTDADSISQGESRQVSCFLRGTIANYPSRLKQGNLTLSPGGASWSPFLKMGSGRIKIVPNFLAVSTRPADHREPNVKKGGSGLGFINVPVFMVVTCTGPDGTGEFVVPSLDESLVASWFRQRLIGS
jgi:hypothetical protein